MIIEAFIIIFTYQNIHFTTHCEYFYYFSTVIILNIMLLAIGMWWLRDAVHGLLVTCVHWSVTPSQELFGGRLLKGIAYIRTLTVSLHEF